MLWVLELIRRNTLSNPHVFTSPKPQGTFDTFLLIDNEKEQTRADYIPFAFLHIGEIETKTITLEVRRNWEKGYRKSDW